MICIVCKKDKTLINHHLSYEPEIIENICWGCHVTMHRLAGMSQEQRDAIIGRIDKYGYLWENGSEKHNKSKHFKDRQEKYHKSERYKNYHREYRVERRFKNLSSEKVIERLNKLEKIVKSIEKGAL